MDESAAAKGASTPDVDAVVTVLMTAPDASSAEEVVRELLDRRLVACGNIVPGAASIYRWKGRLERAEEVVVILKTTGGLAERVVDAARASHPYEVPELIVQEVAGGNPDYLEWVRSECDGDGPAGDLAA